MHENKKESLFVNKSNILCIEDTLGSTVGTSLGTGGEKSEVL